MTVIDKITLNEERIRSNVAGAIIGDVAFNLTIEGASEVSMSVTDPNGRFRRSRFMTEATRIGVGDHRFALVKTSKAGLDVPLVGENHMIHALRARKGPKKAMRDKVTRAQFVKRLVKEAVPDAVFVCPELKTKQPIGKPKKKPGRTVTRKTSRSGGKGISKNASDLTVKGVKATATQKKIAGQILTAAYQHNPPRRALVALLCAVTHESVMGTRGMVNPVDHDSLGILQARLRYVSREQALSIPYNVRRFLKEPWTGTPQGGAIKQANAGRSVGDICTSIQGNATGDVYTQWKKEAQKWIDAYQGGKTVKSTTKTTTTKTKRYAFEVKPDEDYWTAIKRLAGEVGWRAFAVGSQFYFIAETDLYQLKRRVTIGESTRGVDDVDFDLDGRKQADRATITARGNLWKAPPGTIASLSSYWGPASGRWLVAQIEGSLQRNDVTVTLKRPAKPKVEPAPKTVTKTRSRTTTTGSGSGGASKAVTFARKNVGVTQGSKQYNAWMRAVGGFDPWCSFWIAYVMKYVCGFQYLPDNIGHSSCWLKWGKAKRVSKSSLKPGDIVVYDWNGDGATDHVALYVGGGYRIGGNESDRVKKSPVDLTRCVGAVRPEYR